MSVAHAKSRDHQRKFTDLGQVQAGDKAGSTAAAAKRQNRIDSKEAGYNYNKTIKTAVNNVAASGKGIFMPIDRKKSVRKKSRSGNTLAVTCTP